MEQFKALGKGARLALLAGGALTAAAVGYGFWPATQPDVPAPVVATTAATAPVVAANPESASDPAATTAPEPDPTVSENESIPVEEAASAKSDAAAVVSAAPVFDLVRVEPDGRALVAGQAEPGAKIILRVNGAEISGTTADPQGNFTVLFILDPSPTARMLTLGSLLPGQTEVASPGAVALAPTIAALAMAAPTISDADAADVLETVETDETLQTDQPLETVITDPPLQVATEMASAAPNAPAALLVTKDGVNVLQSSNLPDVVQGDANLALDTISYTPAGEVQLAGRATARSVLRVYLDNVALADIAVGADGRWASTMPFIAPGIYSLRIDALAADGTVTARFETPFKRETAASLAAATQTVSPAAGDATVDPGPLASAEQNPADAVETQTGATVAELDAGADLLQPTSNSAAPQTAPAIQSYPNNPVSITVQPGFTLWGIATEQFGDGVLYVQVFEANKDKIRDPDLIYPGQVFVIPAGSE